MTREEKAQYCIDNHHKSPAFQFYPDNWWGSRHVAVMTLEQRGIHASLIFSAWLEPTCGIPENEICLTARINEDKKPITLDVLSWCWFLYNGFWFCERLLNERIKQINISEKRSIAGSEGGRPLKSRFNKKKAIDMQLISKTKANESKSEEEDEDEKEDVNNLKNKEKPLWKTSFAEYEKQAGEAFDRIVSNSEWIIERKKYHPNLDIRLSIEKAFNDFWGQEAGWLHKKKNKSDIINWESTFNNALTLKANQVYEKRN